MFDELFSGDTDLFDESKKETASHTNCASKLQKPEDKRASCNFVGLLNQGSTCYLNSSLQILFMTPQFRKAIYDLPLCSTSLAVPSDFIPQGQKYDILLALQKLFSELNYLTVKARSTRTLTEAFKWSNGEGNEQQDSQEFIRLLMFDVLDRILINTNQFGIINSLYQIAYESRMKCGKCNTVKSRPENEYVLPLQVYQVPSLSESLKISFGNEEVIEDYNCEVCKEKVILHKSNIITHLPVYLNFGLNRFTYDFNSGQRYKLTTAFEYPLEINMKQYCDILNKSIDESEYIYNLYGIIVHSGTPHSGHYYSYIRDMTGQGIWDLEPLSEYLKDPIDPSKNENPTEVVKEIVDTIINSIEEEDKIKGDNKKNKKQKGKGQKEGKGKGKNTQQQKKKKDTNEDIYSRLDYDKCDFPIEYEDKSLANNWYEFNDTSISALRIGRLQKIFKSRSSAYMLFYVKKSKEKSEPIQATDYLLSYTTELNDQLLKERTYYENESNSLYITLYQEEHISYDPIENIFSLKDSSEELKKHKAKFTDTLGQFICTFLGESKEDVEMYLFSFDPVSRMITLKSKFDTQHQEMTLNDLGLYHNCTLIVAHKKTSKLFPNISNVKIGADYEPITLSLLYQSAVRKLNLFGNSTVDILKERIKQSFSFPSEVSINDIQLTFDSNGKSIDVTKICKENKTSSQRTIKEIRLQEKKVITITVNSLSDQLNQKANQKEKKVFDIITCFVKMENEEEDIHFIRIGLDKTFAALVEEIRKEMSLVDDNGEPLPFRVRNEGIGKLIPKEAANSCLSSDESFVEDSVRLKVEMGETYSSDEILIHILYLNESGVKERKEFIGDPNKIKVADLKKLLIDNFINSKEEKVQYDEYKIFKVNAFNEPIKVIKVESVLISKMSIKDNDFIWLRSSKDIDVDNCFISIYQTASSPDLQEHFIPIGENNEIGQLKALKISTVSALKQEIIAKFNLQIDNQDKLRLRVLSCNNEPERILKEAAAQLKKYNLESPVKILIDQLSEAEALKDNQVLLVLMQRNVKEKTYFNKTIQLFQFENSKCSSDQLYALGRKYSKWNSITIAKYSRARYQWEIIPEMDEKGVLNLKKGQYTIRDSDWIGIRNDSEDSADLDDFTTEFDIKRANELEKKHWASKSQSKRTRRPEKPLRITLDDN